MTQNMTQPTPIIQDYVYLTVPRPIEGFFTSSAEINLLPMQTNITAIK